MQTIPSIASNEDAEACYLFWINCVAHRVLYLVKLDKVTHKCIWPKKVKYPAKVFSNMPTVSVIGQNMSPISGVGCMWPQRYTLARFVIN